MPRNAFVEKKLSAVFKLSYEFTEPYQGKKGTYPAEVYCDRGGVYEIVDLFKELHLEQDIVADHLGMRGGLIQVIIKTEEALKAFKNALDQKLVQTLVKSEGENFTFFAFERQNQPSALNSLGYAANDIAMTFNFDPKLITRLKKGFSDTILIHTNDLESAEKIEQSIRPVLEMKHQRTYGGLLRSSGSAKTEALLEVSYDALTDLKKAIIDNQSKSKTPQP